MELLKSKSFTQKLIIALILILLVNFILTPTSSHAASIGVSVANVFLDLFLWIGDGIMHLMQVVVVGFDTSMYTIIREETKVNFWTVVLGVIATVAIIALCVISLGGGLGVAAIVVSGIKVIATGAILGTAITYASSATDVSLGRIPPTLKLPSFVVSPQELFTNKIPMTDVNFFDPLQLEPRYFKKASVYKSNIKAVTEGKMTAEQGGAVRITN